MGQHVIHRKAHFGGVGLLVSVRNAAEALAALAGGADVIDVKEPARGPLGPADPTAIFEINSAVAGRVPVTVASGELVDFQIAGPSRHGQFLATLSGIPDGVCLFKIGLAGCGTLSDWRSRWHRVTESHQGSSGLAAVAYADWRAANAIEPRTVLEAAVDLGCPALLIDTWDKSAGTLFDHLHSLELRGLIEDAHQHGLIVALAGSISPANLREAAALGPDFIAVRGAACEGGRNGVVSRRHVTAICEMMATEPSVGTCLGR